MSDKKVEEPVVAEAAAVQPEQVAEPVKETEKAAEEAVAAPVAAQPEQEPADKTEAEEKPVAEAEKAEEETKKVDEAKPEAEATVEPSDAKVDEQKADEPSEAKEQGDVVSKEANGNVKADEAVTNGDDTNGVCKRKAENGAEVADDEKSPKKAKVVDDVDQAPVEETAA